VTHTHTHTQSTFFYYTDFLSYMTDVNVHEHKSSWWYTQMKWLLLT